jgi:hypothetical protein
MRPLLPSDPVKRAALAARFWRKVRVPKADATRCWLWTGGVHFQVTSTECANPWRVSFALTFGEPGAYVHGTCGTARCVRPDHLTTWKRLAAQVKPLRAKGLLQRQVAARLGVSQTAVWRAERKGRAA